MRELNSRLLRTLLRQGRWMKEGELAGYVRLKIGGAEFEAALSELSGHGFVSVSASGHGRSRRVELTVEGFNEACRLKAEKNRQTAEEVARP